MILPNNGKVLIIDDNINEALPLMKMLSKNKVPSMYFDGKVEDFPDEPFTGIRIVFLDLRFSTVTSDKDVISNVIQILKKLIDNKNGPFILLVWSKHEDEYYPLLCDEINKNGIYPEFIIQLTKSEYFETETNLAEQFTQHSLDLINKYFGDDFKNQELVDELELYLEAVSCFEKKIGKADSLTKIADKLRSELEKANLFSLFVLWENTINYSTTNTVNEIQSQMPRSIPKNKLLAAMLHYMAYYRLEKNTDIVEDQFKFNAAIETLNEMFYYFYHDETQKLSISDVPNFKISNDPDFKRNVSTEKYNRWIMTSAPSSEILPGNIYKDLGNLFVPHGLISGAGETSNRNLEAFNVQEGKIHIFVEISADCDIAQNKRCVLKIIPGVLVLEDVHQRLISESKIKAKSPEYIIDFGILEIETDNMDGTKTPKIMRLLFNLNLATFYDIKAIEKDSAIMALRKSFVVNLQTELGKIISRQGIANF